MRVTPDMIDPQLRLPGLAMKRLLGTSSVEQLRRGNSAITRTLLGRPLRNVNQSEVSIPRPDGTDLRLVVVQPLVARADAPAVLWIHGGGYATGTPEMDVHGARALIDLTGAVVVSPDYRLSGEAPYPAALDDCYAALLWLRDHAARLGARADQIVVGGYSAGGGLTAAVSLLARDRGDVRIAFQCPIYPMIDDRETPSSKDNDAPVWNGATNQNAWRLYLGPLSGADVPAYAAPARATDFAGLPPTITFVGDIEPFRDETIAYVDALRAAGAAVEFRLVPGAWHGFDGIARWTKPAKEARRWFTGRFVDYAARFSAAQDVQRH